MHVEFTIALPDHWALILAWSVMIIINLLCIYFALSKENEASIARSDCRHFALQLRTLSRLPERLQEIIEENEVYYMKDIDNLYKVFGG